MSKGVEEILVGLVQFYGNSADGGKTLAQATKDLNRLIVEARIDELQRAAGEYDGTVMCSLILPNGVLSWQTKKDRLKELKKDKQHE